MSEPSSQTAQAVESKERPRDATTERPASGEREPQPGQRFGTGLDSLMSSLGSRLRQVSDALISRGRDLSAGASQRKKGVSEELHIPEELRGIVERYPIQSMLASGAAGYLLATLVGGKRR
jgi:hypothetical protein